MAKRPRDPSPAKPLPRPVPSPLVRLLTAITYAGLYCGLLMPLVFSETATVYPFIFFKVLVFQAFIGLTVPAFLVLALLDPRYRPRRTWVTVALVAHVAALALSMVFASDRARAFWGNQERMAGFFSMLHFAAWFLVAISVLRTWAQWRRLLTWQAWLGFVMAAVALITLRFPMFLGLRADIRISGLLGNPIYSGAYHMFMLFLLAMLWKVRKEGSRSWPYAVAAAASIGALIGSGSRGPLVGLVAGALVTALVWTAATRRFRVLAAVVGALAVSTGLYAVVAVWLVKLPALAGFWQRFSSLQHLFVADFDPTRRRLWAIAWDGFRERPWTGWGMGSYDIIFDVFYRPICLCVDVMGTMQDSAHSVVFDHLGQTGALGFLTFGALWGAVAFALLRALRQGRLPVPAGAILLGLTAAYLVQGLFVFDSPATLSLTWLLFALAASTEPEGFTAAAPPPALPSFPAPRGRIALPALLVLQALAALLVHRTSFQPGRASNLMREAHESYRRGNCAEMLTYAQQAFATPTPYLDDQVYTLARDLGSLAQKGNLERCTTWRELMAHEKRVIEKLLQDHPEHARQRSVHANFITIIGRTMKDPALVAEAGPLLDLLVRESPSRQMYRFDRGHWLIDQGRIPEAQADFERALAVEESIGVARWQLGVFRWNTLKQAQSGAALMIRAMKGACPHALRGPMEVQQLAQAYAVLRDREGLRTVVKHLTAIPKTEPAGAIYVGVAHYFEDLAMLPERDQVLALAFDRDAALRPLVQPVLAGRVKTLAEAEALAGQAKAP